MGWMGEPTALTLLAASVGWLLLGVLPGFLVGSAVTPDRSALDRLAVAPAVSLGLAFPPAVWAARLGLEAALPVALAVLGLASTAAGLVLLRRSRTGRGGALLDGSLRATAPALVVVGAVWLVAIGTSHPGWGVVAPNSDGNNHGLAVVQLIQGGLSLGSSGYPLGLHLVAALVGAVTSVPSALVVPFTLLGSTWLVLGTSSLAARVSRPAVPWTALAACVVAYFPYGQVEWGPIPLVLAVALVPGVTLTVLDSVASGGAHARRGLAVAAVALAGLFAVHVTEAFVVGLLVLVTSLGRRGATTVRSLLLAAGVGVSAFALCSPLLVAILRQGGSGGQTPVPVRGDGAGSAVLAVVLQPFVGASWFPPPAWPVILLAAVGLVAVTIVGARACWASAIGRAVAALVLLCLVLAALARVGGGGVLTLPWYGNGDRLVAQAAALVPVLLGVGLGRVLSARHTTAYARVATGAVLTCCLIGLVQSTAVAREGLSRFSVVTPDDRAAFAWLAVHARPDEAVLNDNQDGSVWMVEATDGSAEPLFGMKPNGGYATEPEWTDRLYLRDHVADFATDPRVRAIAAHWHVRYVFSGERTFADVPRLVDADALARAPGVVEVFHSGGARVFELPAS